MPSILAEGQFQGILSSAERSREGVGWVVCLLTCCPSSPKRQPDRVAPLASQWLFSWGHGLLRRSLQIGW